MTADDIQPIPPRSADSTMDHLTAPASGPPVRADALERWTRAVTTALKPTEDGEMDSSPLQSVQVTSDSARALPLSELRGRHASHRYNHLDATVTEGVDAERNALQATPRSLPPSADAAPANDSVTTASGSQQLHALIESCCSRLWVSDEAGRGPQGVMLDLGRWMPGCTMEVAKAAGVLRITLRGVEGSASQRLEGELMDLGEGLAQKIGCQVVAAVAKNKEST